MYKIIALIGEAGSGKDTILNKLASRNPEWNKIISATTRPMREGEQEGVNYYYLTPEEFTEQINNQDMLEAVIFNNWAYGTTKKSLKEDVINIGVFNPSGVEILAEYADINLEIFLVQVSEKERLIRQLNRESNPNIDEIIRRLYADRTDFEHEDLDFDYFTLYNETQEDIPVMLEIVEIVASRM